MSTAPEFNFEMHQGDTKFLHIAVKDPAGVAVSLVGAKSIKWWVAKKVTSTTRLLEKASSSGITVTNAAGGLLTISIAPDDTKLVSGDYYHELEVVDATDHVATILRGTMSIVRALVTNPVPPP
jgi:hypothetical protein